MAETRNGQAGCARAVSRSFLDLVSRLGRVAELTAELKRYWTLVARFSNYHLSQLTRSTLTLCPAQASSLG